MAEEDLARPDGSRRPADIPRPVRCEHLRVDPRGYPIISVIAQSPGKEDYGALSEPRKLVLATYDLCAVCALPFGDELRWQVTFDDQLQHMGAAPTFAEAPVHEVCALYAAQVCPFVSSPYARLGDAIRKGQRRPDVVVLAGFERTVSVFGHASELQAGESIVMFEMGGLRRTHRLTGAADARSAYDAALHDETPIELDDAEQRVVELLCAPTEDGEDSGTVMAGAAWLIGAAFCPQVRQVQGMRRFADHRDDLYFQLAGNFLLDPERMAGWEDARDPSTAAAVSWFRSRAALPAVLQQWRDDGWHRIRSTGSRQVRPRTDTQPRRPLDEEALRTRRAAEAALRKKRKKTR